MVAKAVRGVRGALTGVLVAGPIVVPIVGPIAVHGVRS
jgi:hypothetical protein